MQGDDGDIDFKVILQDKHVELWISGDAQESETEKAIEFCRGYGMPIVIYRSGRCSLGITTGMLLHNNASRNTASDKSVL